jgi:hypothetical protein
LRINTTTLLSSTGDALASAVRTRSWDWLRLLCARLNIEAHLVNAQGTPILLDGQSPATPAGRLLSAQAPTVRAAVSATVQGQAPQALAIDGIQLVCAAVTTGDPSAGVLVLTKPIPAGTKPDSTRAELEIVGQWLAPAIAAHLQSAVNLPDEGVSRVSALMSVLDATAANLSDRDLVLAFADALAVWYDLELTAYVETAPGRFVREVALLGADSKAAPGAIAASDLPPDLVPSALTRIEADRLGMHDTDSVLVARIDGPDHASWLLLMRLLSSEVPDLSRLGVYVRMLERWLTSVAAQAVVATGTAVSRMLFERSADPAIAAERALEYVRTQAKAESLRLEITVDGRSLLRAQTRGAEGDDDRGSDTSMPLSPTALARLSVVPREGSQFSPVERRTITAVAEIVRQWGRLHLIERHGVADRRTVSRRFDDVIDRFAQQALERGFPVSVLVLTLDADVTAYAAVHRDVSDIRSQVRPSDLVGTLGEREIGLLLHETSPDQARHVADRLRTLIESAHNGRGVAAIGLAARAPGSAAAATGVVQEARSHGLERHVA